MNKSTLRVLSMVIGVNLAGKMTLASSSRFRSPVCEVVGVLMADGSAPRSFFDFNV